MTIFVNKLHSVFFKYHLKRLLNHLATVDGGKNLFGITTRPGESTVKSDPSFHDGVATKDLHISSSSSLSVRIFLPVSALSLATQDLNRTVYGGYFPSLEAVKRGRKLPVVLQFHGSGFVSGSNESIENDAFCRKVAKQWDSIVVAVGYRLAPETKYPGAFDDGHTVLNWLAKQFNLAAYIKAGPQGHIFDSFGASMADPWLTAHADPSRCVLLGICSGANIANQVSRKFADSDEKLIEPLKIVAQVLLYPFFIGSRGIRIEETLNSYIWDKEMCIMAWKLFFTEAEFDVDHPAANPLAGGRHQKTLHRMPPTLTVVADDDFMRERAVVYIEELRKVKVDAHVIHYKNAVHGFATIGPLLHTKQAQACSEDIAIWVKKYISLRGYEFSY